MKSLTLFQDNGRKAAHVEVAASAGNEAAVYEVDIPHGHAIVGVYGTLGSLNGFSAIMGFGLLTYAQDINQSH